jgi:hypothetical protein
MSPVVDSAISRLGNRTRNKSPPASEFQPVGGRSVVVFEEDLESCVVNFGRSFGTEAQNVNQSSKEKLSSSVYNPLKRFSFCLSSQVSNIHRLDAS